MTLSNALDLGQIDPPIWHVLIRETAYGPYTLGQMKTFISEGRVRLSTKIAKGDGAPFVPAETLPDLQAALQGSLHNKPARSETSDTQHNYVIVAQLATPDTDLISLLNEFGKFAEAMPGVYILQSEQRLSVLKQALNNKLSSADKTLIIDASSNRLGWINLEADLDEHLRTLWRSTNDKTV